jgi:radical SAM superfamily enzyme YgiQ (UPF0313 family)
MAPPLGVLRVAGFLNERGHYAEYFDPNIHRVTTPALTLKQKIAEQDWDIIGFSLLDETLMQDLENIHLAHRLAPKARLVAGGIEAQFNYQTVLDKTPCRTVVIGEGEIPILMMADGKPLHEIPGIVYKNDAIPLSAELFNEATDAIRWESVPYEHYWNYYVQKYGDRMTAESEREIHTVRVFSRNRCPIACKFCSSTNQLTWGSGGKVPVISATGDMLISVIDRIVASHPRVKTIYLTDDDFCINKRDVIRFCQRVVERNYDDLSFLCFARVTDLTDELLGWMKKANFRRLNIGVDSFSDEVLDEMGKRCTAAEIHQALAMVKKHGIRPFMNLILITPKTTIGQLELTITEALRYAEDPFYNAGFALAVIPLKGSEFNDLHWDFLSTIETIPNTDIHVRRDKMIWAQDLVVRRRDSRSFTRIQPICRYCGSSTCAN